MKVEVLVATMHQKDFSKLREMNIQSDVVFANQADKQTYSEMAFGENHIARMVTTDQRGVGRNRNLALLYAKGDILLFSDDDMVYADGYEERIIDAFEKFPNADVIVFELDYEKQGNIYLESRHSTKIMPMWKSLRYGAARIAIRRASLEKHNIWFHTQFGGGCKYSSGEDSLFLVDCYRKNLRVYTYSYCLGRCKKDSSTWFEGYTEKYFKDKGSWIACAMPKMCSLIAPLLAIKWHKKNKALTALETWKFMKEGILRFRKET